MPNTDRLAGLPGFSPAPRAELATGGPCPLDRVDPGLNREQAL